MLKLNFKDNLNRFVAVSIYVVHRLPGRKGRGVSEIVATILLVLMVVSIGMGVFLYSMGYMSLVSSARSDANSLDVAVLKERFIIVDANVATTSAQIAVYNYGETNVKIVGLYINGMLHSPPSGITILPGKYQFINATYGSLNANSMCTIRVVSSLGNYYEDVYWVYAN